MANGVPQTRATSVTSCPKPARPPAKPELGTEMASEGEALIEAFKNGQQFYTLTAWKAMPKVNGKSSPIIVKQALAQT